MTEPSPVVHDIVIIGGGIAGLATAEMFSRAGGKVHLVEAQAKLGLGSSGAHHEWFHFGSLYSIFTSNKFLRVLLDGVDDLLRYYGDFTRMNIRVGETDGRVSVAADETGWFRPDAIHYVVAAPNDPAFRWNSQKSLPDNAWRFALRWLWDFRIKQLICRHNRFYFYDWRRGRASKEIPTHGLHNYSRRNIEKWRNPDIHLDPDQHFLIRGYDRPMRARQIMSDLAERFLGQGGTLSLDTRYESWRRLDDGTIEVALAGRAPLRTRKLVLATGGDLAEQSRGKLPVQRVRSPLLIVYPAVAEENFVRLTPFTAEAICHLLHFVDGRAYSVIGGGWGLPPGDPAGEKKLAAEIISRAREVFPRMASAQLAEVYFALKAEAVDTPTRRNYGFSVRRLAPDIYGLLPGKFSLGFSAAVGTYKLVTGQAPPRVATGALVPVDRALIEESIGWMRHKEMVRAVPKIPLAESQRQGGR